MDVHDVGDYQKPLAAGMAFIIEPGIYIRPQALDNLEDTPENRAFKEKVTAAVEKYKGIGVRIEDSFLLTPTGLKRLSATTPRTIEEIERYLKTPRGVGADRGALNSAQRRRHFFQTRSAKSAKRSQSYGVRSWPPVRT